MKCKKILSTFAAIAIAASSFAGLGITANAADNSALPIIEDFSGGTDTEASNLFGVTTVTSDLAKIVASKSQIIKTKLSNYGNALMFNNGTLTATLDGDSATDGVQPVKVNSGKAITVEFDTFGGYLNSKANPTVTLKDSSGKAIVSYTYNLTNCTISDIKIGGSTVSGFAAFSGQSWYGKKSNGNYQGSNGWTNGYNFKNNEGYNGHVVMTVDSAGIVKFDFSRKATPDATEVTTTSYSAACNVTDIATVELTSGDISSNVDRAYAIDNLKISEIESTIVKAKYKVVKKYVEGERSVVLETSEETEGVEGEIPVLDLSNYEKDGQRYIYVSNDTETIGALDSSKGTLTYTITYRKATENTFNVTAKCGEIDLGTVAANVTGTEADTVYVPYHRYIVKDSVAYKKDATNKMYKHPITVAQTQVDVSLDYTSYMENVAYFSEAEDIEGMTKSNIGQGDARSSNAYGAYAGNNVVITTLPAGKYKLATSVCGGDNKEDTKNVTFEFVAGETSVLSVRTNGSYSDATSEEFILLNDTDIVLKAAGTEDKLVDYVLIEKTGDVPVISTATMTAPSGITEPRTTTAKEVDRKTGTVASDSPVALTGVKTVYIKVDNAVANVMPTVKVKDVTYTPTYKYTAGSCGYFVYQFVGIDLTGATVTYTGAADTEVNQAGDGGSEV